MPRRPEINADNYSQAASPTLGEYGLETEDVVVEQETSMDAAELAAFMEEKVVIRLAKVKDAKPLELVSPSVNGRIQHLFRGIPQVCARKYVEVLMRSHQISYDYEVEANVAILEGELPKAATTPTHSLELIQDTERGRRWFEEIRRQPV